MKESIEALKEAKKLYRYCPQSGNLTSVTTGCTVITKSRNGYLRVAYTVGGVVYGYAAHRICWALHHNKFPTLQIDHINKDKLDNRIENLREVTNRQNSVNRSSTNPCIHAEWKPKKRVFVVRCRQTGGAQMYFGTFKELEKAKLVAEEALKFLLATELWGDQRGK